MGAWKTKLTGGAEAGPGALGAKMGANGGERFKTGGSEPKFGSTDCGQAKAAAGVAAPGSK